MTMNFSPVDKYLSALSGEDPLQHFKYLLISPHTKLENKRNQHENNSNFGRPNFRT